ncbi:MAG: dolichyl-phosphate beta-glucosyltransferase [Candidatus Binatia bacterium]
MTPPGFYLSIVVPAYNEAARLPSTLQRIQEYLSRLSLSAEIIVVLDGPTDATREIARAAARDVPQLKILDRKINRGKGFTVREGMLAGSGQIRLFCDADNSTDIAHFDKMKPLFDQGYDIVIASRSAKDAPEALQVVSQAWYKRALGRLGNRIVQTAAVPGIWDTQCGFKAFRAEAAERIFAQTTIERWGFDIEVLALAQRLGYKIGIVSARWFNDDRSNVKLSDYLHVLGDTFTVRRNLLSGKYRL